MRSFFITGTNTNVGKTVVTALLAAFFHSLGKVVVPYKPVQSGAIVEKGRNVSPDVRLYQLALPNLTIDVANSYLFKKPFSPHLAAKEEGIKISSEDIIKHYRQLKDTYEIVLVEGAGGLYTPLMEDGYCIIDLIKKLDIPAILVAPTGLGTINQTALSVRALKQYDIPIAGIILNQLQVEEPLIETDNRRMIEKLTGVPVISVIPFINNVREFLRNNENVQQLFTTFNFNVRKETETNEYTSTS